MVKGFTLAFFFFESIERMLEARSDWTSERTKAARSTRGREGWMERKSWTEAVQLAIFQAEDGPPPRS